MLTHPPAAGRSRLPLLLAGVAVAASAALGWGGAGLVEATVAERVAARASAAGLDWLRIEVDGARVTLSGAPPDAAAAEAARAAARSAARYATVLDSLAPPPPAPAPPAEPVALEILVDAAGATLSGVAPDAGSLEALARALGLEHPPPLARAGGTAPAAGPDWTRLREVAAEAARQLDHGRVALAPGRLAISGLPRDAAAGATLARLAAAAAEIGAETALDLETVAAVPSAAAAPAASPPAAARPAPGAPPPPPEALWLRAERSADLVTLVGAAPDAPTRMAVLSWARAAFGAGMVHDGLAVAEAAGPEGWRAAALAALDALARLEAGRAEIAGGRIRVEGVALDPRAARAAQDALAPGAAGGWTAATRVTIDLPTLAAIGRLSPARCAEELTAVAADDPIRFAPSSAEIDPASAAVLDALSATLARCDGGRIEVGGHTDSQGSEGYNQRLSQARAEAVRAALEGRGAPPGLLTARGYGESAPIADNAEESGRALNRRIAFRPAGSAPDAAANAVAADGPAAP